VKRNLEQRDASGSMILYIFARVRERRPDTCEGAPCHVVADKTKPSYPCISFHYPTKSTLRVLCHRICFVKNNNFIWRTRISLSVRRYSLSSRCLSSKAFDLVTNDRNPSFIRSIQFKDSVSKIVWANKVSTISYDANCFTIPEQLPCQCKNR
jgi:hypothetical protein